MTGYNDKKPLPSTTNINLLISTSLLVMTWWSFTNHTGNIFWWVFFVDFIECFMTTFLRAHSWLNWVVFWCVDYSYSFKHVILHYIFNSTQFSQEWARRKVVVKHSIKHYIFRHIQIQVVILLWWSQWLAERVKNWRNTEKDNLSCHKPQTNIKT